MSHYMMFNKVKQTNKKTTTTTKTVVSLYICPEGVMGADAGGSWRQQESVMTAESDI